MKFKDTIIRLFSASFYSKIRSELSHYIDSKEGETGMENQSKKIITTYIILFLGVIVTSFGAFCALSGDYIEHLLGWYVLPVAVVVCTGGIIIGTTNRKQMLIYLLISLIFCFYVNLLHARYIIAEYDNIIKGIIGFIISRSQPGVSLGGILIYSTGMFTAVIGEVIGKVGNTIYKKQKENQNEN